MTVEFGTIASPNDADPWSWGRTWSREPEPSRRGWTRAGDVTDSDCTSSGSGYPYAAKHPRLRRMVFRSE